MILNDAANCSTPVSVIWFPLRYNCCNVYKKHATFHDQSTIANLLKTRKTDYWGSSNASHLHRFDRGERTILQSVLINRCARILRLRYHLMSVSLFIISFCLLLCSLHSFTCLDFLRTFQTTISSVYFSIVFTLNSCRNPTTDLSLVELQTVTHSQNSSLDETDDSTLPYSLSMLLPVVVLHYHRFDSDTDLVAVMSTENTTKVISMQEKKGRWKEPLTAETSFD